MSPTSMMLAAGSEGPASRLSTLPEGEPDLTLGWEAILWAEKILLQPNGPRAGQPFRFTRDQLRFVLWWYALDDEGQWLFQHGVRRHRGGRARGGGRRRRWLGIALRTRWSGQADGDKDERRVKNSG